MHNTVNEDENISLLSLLLENRRIRREVGDGIMSPGEAVQQFVESFFSKEQAQPEKDSRGVPRDGSYREQGDGLSGKYSFDYGHARATTKRADKLGGGLDYYGRPGSKQYSKFYTPSGKSRNRVKSGNISIHRPSASRYLVSFRDESRLVVETELLQIKLTAKSSTEASQYLQGNADKVIRFFEKRGYAVLGNNGKPVEHYGVMYLAFDPQSVKPVTDVVRETEQWLYHASPTFNEDSIRQNGFIPSNQQTRFSGNRIYFVLGSDKEASLQFLVRQLRKVAREHAKERGRLKKDFDKWTIYRVKVSLIPEDVEFFVDPEDNNDEFVYVKQTVPYSCVRGMSHIDLTGKKDLSPI